VREMATTMMVTSSELSFPKELLIEVVEVAAVVVEAAVVAGKAE